MIISKIFRYELYNFHGGLVNSGGLKSTKAYLEQILKHLYNGFRVNIEFGIGYRHQSISTVEIPGILAEFFERGLNNILKAGELKNVNVSFLRAGTSSLDYEVEAHLAGTAADRYEDIEREIARLFVVGCNKYGWFFPFEQLVLHQAA